MQHDHIAASGFDPVQHISQVVERVHVADRHKNVAGTRADRFGGQLALHRQVELVHFHVVGGVMRHAFGKRKNNEKKYREGTPGDGSFRLGEEVDHRDTQKHGRDQPKSNRNFDAKHVEIQRNAVFAVSGMRVAQDQDRHTLHRETPDHSERIEVREKCHVAPAYDDGENLQRRDNVDDPVRCAETPVRLAEPTRQNAVFRNAIEHAVRAYNRRVHRACQDQGAHDDNEPVKYQPQQERALEIHRQATDEVFEELRPLIIGNQHHREEGHQRGENQAVNKNHQTGFLQIRQLRVLNFAIDLRQGFFSAHRQHRMAEPDKDGNETREMRQVNPVEPAQCVRTQPQIAGVRDGGQNGVTQDGRVDAPADQDRDHQRRDLHDSHGLLAGLVDTLDVVPPEINRAENGEARGAGVGRNVNMDMNVG